MAVLLYFGRKPLHDVGLQKIYTGCICWLIMWFKKNTTGTILTGYFFILVASIALLNLSVVLTTRKSLSVSPDEYLWFL